MSSLAIDLAKLALVPDVGAQPEQPKRKLKGGPLADLIDKPINEADTLLGNRYLCRGGALLIVAPSGQGKSVMKVQAAIQWAVGRPAFGIKPARPLRILIVQAEDDEGDCIEMAQIAKHLNLSSDELALLEQNVWLEHVNDLCAHEFTEALDGFLEEFPADLVMINPLTAYLGSDDKDQKAATLFLRNWLNPVLTKHNCAAVIIHHTPKTNFASTDNYKPSDWMYRGAGAATITNWSRAYLVIDPCDLPGVYKFIAAKRGKRIGWGHTTPVFETYWAHTKEEGKLLWIPASEAEIKAAMKAEKTSDDLLAILPIGEELTKEQIQKLAKQKLGIGQKAAVTLLKEIVANGEIDCRDHQRSGTRPEKKYVRTR